MKIIFSRKGFDSSAGGVPNPIIAGRPVSLPIPTRMPTSTRYVDLANGISNLVQDLTKGRISPGAPCHLDPDLDPTSLPRLPGWRGSLGQVSAAQSHLSNNGIGPGDVFLFWGLFRRASRAGATQNWTFAGPSEHRIFGWLQIDEVLPVKDDPSSTLATHPWLAGHPHVEPGWPHGNTVYVGNKELRLNRQKMRVAGFGLFKQGIRLTSLASQRPSVWRVPPWLNPLNGGVGLTYHPLSRWTTDNELRTAARGQEFVADIGEREDALAWLVSLFTEEA